MVWNSYNLEVTSVRKPPPPTLTTLITCSTRPLKSLGVTGSHQLTRTRKTTGKLREPERLAALRLFSQNAHAEVQSSQLGGIPCVSMTRHLSANQTGLSWGMRNPNDVYFLLEVVQQNSETPIYYFRAPQMTTHQPTPQNRLFYMPIDSSWCQSQKFMILTGSWGEVSNLGLQIIMENICMLEPRYICTPYALLQHSTWLNSSHRCLGKQGDESETWKWQIFRCNLHGAIQMQLTCGCRQFVLHLRAYS